MIARRVHYGAAMFIVIVVLVFVLWACVDIAVEQGKQERRREEQKLQECLDRGDKLITTGGSQGRTVCLKVRGDR